MERAAALAEKYASQYSLKRDDSTDELLKSVRAQREARKKQLLERKAAEEQGGDSGRSTPDHLKNYPGSSALHNTENNNVTTSSNGEAAEASAVAEAATTAAMTGGKRLRTFSETLKMLDDDILDDLDVVKS